MRSCVQSVWMICHAYYISNQQIQPTSSNGVDGVNFRHLKESHSLHLEGGSTKDVVGIDDDQFGAFSSVTLHYDGE